jgi:hypothetical protein
MYIMKIKLHAFYLFWGMYIIGISKLFEPNRSFTLKIDQMLVVLLSVPENHEHGISSVVLCTTRLEVYLVPDL